MCQTRCDWRILSKVGGRDQILVYWSFALDGIDDLGGGILMLKPTKRLARLYSWKGTIPL